MTLLRSLIADGYGDARTLRAPRAEMEAWIANPVLLRDKDADMRR